MSSGMNYRFRDDEFYLTVKMTTVSTAGSTWIVCPVKAKINKIYSVLNGTIATADAAITVEIGGVAVTNAGITIAYSGSAAGDIDSSTPTAKNVVNAGQAIEIITSGASTNAIAADFTLVMERM